MDEEHKCFCAASMPEQELGASALSLSERSPSGNRKKGTRPSQSCRPGSGRSRTGTAWTPPRHVCQPPNRRRGGGGGGTPVSPCHQPVVSASGGSASGTSTALAPVVSRMGRLRRAAMPARTWAPTGCLGMKHVSVPAPNQNAAGAKRFLYRTLG